VTVHEDEVGIDDAERVVFAIEAREDRPRSLLDLLEEPRVVGREDVLQRPRPERRRLREQAVGVPPRQLKLPRALDLLGETVDPRQRLTEQVHALRAEAARRAQDSPVNPGEQVAVARRARLVGNGDLDEKVAGACPHRSRHADPRSSQLLVQNLEKAQLGARVRNLPVRRPVHPEHEASARVRADLEDGVVRQPDRRQPSIRRNVVRAQRRSREVLGELGGAVIHAALSAGTE
jgi:hypothetical protein